MADIFLIFLLELKIYCQGRFLKLYLRSFCNKVICFEQIGLSDQKNLTILRLNWMISEIMIRKMNSAVIFVN